MNVRVIYTAGVWDLLHRGHQNLLLASAQLGDRLVVGVVSDDGTARYKGFYPTESEETRLRRVRALPYVDAALIQEGTDPSDILRIVRPDVMTHGSDWKRLREGHATLERLRIEWRLLPYTPGVSSSMLREQRRTG